LQYLLYFFVDEVLALRAVSIGFAFDRFRIPCVDLMHHNLTAGFVLQIYLEDVVKLLDEILDSLYLF